MAGELTSTTPIREMAQAVGALVNLKRDHLFGLERLSFDRGIETGPDLAFAGIRIVLAQGEAAMRLLLQLAPYEAELQAWLAARARSAA
jgi:hypothetical protein